MAFLIISQDVIDRLKKDANENIPVDSSDEKLYRPYATNCSHFHSPTGTIIVYSKDTRLDKLGLNHPELRNALHLSLSFRQPEPKALSELLMINTAKLVVGIRPLLKFDWQLAKEWIKLIYPNINSIWREGNGTDSRNRPDPISFFVFTDSNWQPIRLSLAAIYELKNVYLLQEWQG